jgi:large subunit ribosomal protein L2
MAIKVYKKNAAGRRNMSIVKPDQVTVGAMPEKSLLRVIRHNAGRSNGKISVRHQGGGHKRRYRLVDFRQDKHDIPGKIAQIERDPNRSALIALVNYKDGEKRYVLATSGMKVGQEILSGATVPVADGNRMKLSNIPAGTVISCVEMRIGRGAQIVRSAGSSATLMALDENGRAQVKLSSGEVRLISGECFATIGQVSNFEHGAERIGKAGRSRWKGKRPAVRGSVMNPVDHPHGGGEGCQPIGLKAPKTPWGKIALGKKTRKRKKASNQYILKARAKKRK